MKKIMVVDDEPDQILTLKYCLKEIDNEFEVTSASNGEECLEILKNSKDLPDLLLLDVMMPAMNGFEVYDNLKNDPKLSFLPVIFLTASNDEFEKDVSEVLADDYIIKPFETEDLINRIRKVLDRK